MALAKPISLAVALAMLPCVASGAAACGSGGAARVMVIPSIHKLLASNPNYGYARLYAIVAAFHPDLVGVEIRQEDLARPADYLKRNYPREMVALAAAYPDRVFGFDWLGDEIRGVPVPDDWWTKHSRVKQLERAWNTSPPPLDDRMKRLNHEVDALSARQDAIARTASPNALATGPYDRITAVYYATIAMLMRNTPYAVLPQWYAARDQHIDATMVEEIRLHPGCRIVIVTGADHHGPAVAAIEALGHRATLAVP